ncbi:putative signal peptide protein [Puccinia sorghi]|uniref:Putative signal peptide protein n=1 Tax=Puccinia sorghi TaxID=27349 RepID=A0A0L6UJE3_9BASI|nr:putative signal peptide protein [Puccinia sorghi]
MEFQRMTGIEIRCFLKELFVMLMGCVGSRG